MRRRRIILCLVLLLVMIAAIRWRASHGPSYQGRLVSNWVEEALHEDGDTEASKVVLSIGAPAVPFIASQGLHGRSHVCPRLSTDWLMYFQGNHPRLGRWLKLDDWDFCVPRHLRAARLLSQMGTNAIAAMPDLINCFEHCPECHYINAYDLLQAIDDVDGTNSTAISFFTKVAREKDSFALQAAANVYYLDEKTNLFVETCERLAGKNPKNLAGTRELFWFRQEHELNQHLVPLLEKIYANSLLDDHDRESILFELESRSNDATAAIARILAAQTNLVSTNAK